MERARNAFVRPRALLALTLLLLAIPLAQCSDYTNRELDREMDSLVDSVRSTVRDAERAHDHKEVLDLGQSLHLLEHKFAGLKAAIAQEMGTNLNSPREISHTAEAKAMVDAASKLLDEMAAYRNDMQRLLTHMREIEDSINSAKSLMGDFDKEVDEMNRLLGGLHVDSAELHENHRASVTAVDETTRFLHAHANRSRGHHKWYMFVLLLEAGAVFCWFYYAKRNTFASAKSLHKF